MLADLRFALRQLAKSPGFTAVALLTLALGIGANTAVFSIVQAVLLRPLPYPQPEQLVILWEDETNFPQASIAWPDLQDWQRDNHSFSALGGFRRDNYTLTGTGDPEVIRGAASSAALFDAVGLAPIRGRVFRPDEDAVGAPPLAVIGYGLWQRKFGGRDDAVGQAITLNGERFTVIGVLPADFSVPNRIDFWTQLARRSDKSSWQNRGNHPGIYALGRVKPGITIESAMADLRTISARIAKDNPDTSTGVVAAGEPLFENAVGSYRRGLVVLLASVGFVLLIACANLANLLLARAAAREGELAVRAALGASRGRIIRQLFVESLVLAVGGAALGLVLAVCARDGILALSPVGVPRFQQVAIDGRVLAVTCGLTIVTALLSGWWPAWRVAQTDLRAALSTAGRGGSGGRSLTRAREMLIVTEIALTVILLTGAGLLLRSFARMQTVNLGFDPRGILTARISLPDQGYPSQELRRGFYERLLTRIRELPGVKSADLATNPPLDTGWQTSWHVTGTPPAAPGQEPLAEMNVVSDTYFATFGIPILRGRAFGPQDHATATTAVIIDQAFAQRAWPNQDPIGQRIRINTDEENPALVVGVVPTLQAYGYATEPKLVQAYLSVRQDAQTESRLIIRADGDPGALTAALRRALAEIDPNQAAWDVKPMLDRIDATFATPRLYTYLLAIFAGLALLLASVGLYGVLAFQVGRRTREFGIRIALGALHGQIVGLVLRRGFTLLAIGVAIGMAGAWALGRLLGSLLYKTDSFDLTVIAIVTAVLTTVATVASWLPARRTLRIDPTNALRSE